MIPISSVVSGSLTWSKISGCQGYELRLNTNNDAVATLQKVSFWSSTYRAETQNGQWTFRRAGCLNSGAEIVDASSQQTIAILKSAWGSGGTLTFADGQTFRIQCEGWWRPVWSVIAEGGQPVLHLHRRERTVELSPTAALPDDRLALLIVFTWYRVLQAEEDAAVAVMVAAS
jgi:hypothetical protein